VVEAARRGPFTARRERLSPSARNPVGPEAIRLLLWSVVVGLLGGGAALGLRVLATRLPQIVWGGGNDLLAAVSHASPAMRLAIPVLGAVLAGTVLTLGERWAGSARGWDILEAVVLRDGVLHPRPTLVKCASSLVTVASAGAVGREGPIVLLSATVASLAGRWLKAGTRDLRILAGCGIAAGMACAYNTPVAAALFTLEIIFGSFALDVFAPLVMSSVVATLLTRATLGDAPVFHVPQIAMASPWEILPYALLGLLGGLTAAAFLILLRGSAALFRRISLPRPLAMAVAGLVLGIVIQWFPEVVGNGREAIGNLFDQRLATGYALALLVLRLIVTPLTVGSGAVGGVFTPALFLGAMLGGAFGTSLHSLLPAVAAEPRAYALVGMACLLAGTTHAPLMSVITVFEMTLDYDLVLPLLLGSVISTLIARAVAGDSVYTEALRRQERSGPGGVMGALTVGDVVRAEHVTVRSDVPLPALLDRFAEVRRNHLYVVDEAGLFLGAVNLHDASRALRASPTPASVRVRDVMSTRFEATVPEEPLDQALERFFRQDAERLPVLDSREGRHLVGTISKRDILGVYSLERLQRDASTFPQGGPDGVIGEVGVPADLAGATVQHADFQGRYGLSIVMVRPSGTGWVLPSATIRLGPEDRLIVFGARDRIDALAEETPP
jgi:CIC family chloride channel protein